ncbi:fascin domain-containing protein [Vibrio porteresiae]|uniref:Uncharacterized protein n=1 Tax=Vibrio porteresiae DSM 19223 TaxID=1123496 RepID=A0ABZ0Q9R1_9VIBR|nr:hypothetical protein [Vibrio porteresiae]WPC72675.1 hypothetical protein R8Z52_11105 [Vibrio porteresiae DSM 19223]
MANIPVFIKSNQFPKCLVRMASEDNPVTKSSGLGTVNCQMDQNSVSKNPWEVFNLIQNDDGTFSFESNQFPGNYLRMRGSTEPQQTAPGFGTVNCQGKIGSYEKFKIELIDETDTGILVSIESNKFPSNYLRMAGEDNPTPVGSGFGTVNCQASVGPYEKFYLVPTKTVSASAILNLIKQ